MELLVQLVGEEIAENVLRCVRVGQQGNDVLI